MKLSDIERIMKGTRAIKRVELPLVNLPGPLQADQPELAAQREANGLTERKAFEVGVRVLTGEELVTVYERAWRDAKTHGAAEPNEKDPVYALHLSVWTLALACVDPDSPDLASPALFFGDTPDEAARNILASPHLGRDGIAYLHEQQEYWQDLCHPQAAKIDAHKMWEMIGEVAASDDAGPFFRMRPALRWILLRSMALQQRDLLLNKFSSSSDSETDGNSGSKSETS